MSEHRNLVERSVNLTVLYVGSFGEISTSRLRADALQAVGVRVEPMDGDGRPKHTHFAARAFNRLLGFPFHRREVSRKLVVRVQEVRPDVVWLDKAVFAERWSLDAVRRVCNPLIVHYNPDDPFGHARGFWSTFVGAIPAYDVHLVPRRENIGEYMARGAKQVIPFDRGFCRRAHRPPARHHPRWNEFCVPVAFTGTFERERAESIGRLIGAGVPVAIRGGLWDSAATWASLRSYFRGLAVAGEEYALALGAPQITLHFLRHANRDEQDSRTFEIPACGGFMMAEWSPRHSELFQEDREAVFFRNDDELLEKVKYYLARPEECAAIAARGRARVLSSGYDYESRILELLRKSMQAGGRRDLLLKLPQVGGAVA